MDPNHQQPYIPQQNNPYDFIMQDQKRKRRFAFGAGGSKKRLLLLVGGALVAIFILMSLYNLVFGGKDKSAQLINLAAEQQEIVRVADLGVTDAIGTEAKNLAVTTKNSVTSEQKQLISLLAKGKKKITKEQLAAKKNTSVDKTLSAAKENNRFDEAFIEIMKASLKDYSASLESNYNSLTSNEARTILKTSYDSTQNLLK